MDYFVIGFLVASATLCCIAIYSYRRSRRLEKENHERLMRELDENNARIRQARAERRSKMTSLYTPASATKVVETRAHQDRYSDRRAVDDNSDMLTMMILQNALNSSSDTVSGSVRWDNDTPTITPTSSYESSSSSSYSSYSSSDSSSSYSDSSSSDSGSSSSCD
jgi:hypothetical protein